MLLRKDGMECYITSLLKGRSFCQIKNLLTRLSPKFIVGLGTVYVKRLITVY